VNSKQLFAPVPGTPVATTPGTTVTADGPVNPNPVILTGRQSSLVARQPLE
jgi:hypothetical protein